MSSDIFFTQLVPQSFSSGSSFDSVSSSAAGKRLGSTRANDDPTGSQGSFENTLNRLSDTNALSSAATHSASGRTKAQEQEQTTGPTGVTEDGSPGSPDADNLLGVSHDQAATGEADGLDPMETVHLDSLTAILQKLENVLTLSNQPGQTPHPGVREAISVLSDILGASGEAQSTGSGSGEAALEKLEALLEQLQTGSQNKLSAEIQNMTELFQRIPSADAQKLLKSAEVTKLLQNLTALLPNDTGKGTHQSQSVQSEVQSQTGIPDPGEKLAAGGRATAGVQIAVNEQGSASLPDGSQITPPQAGLKESTIRTPEGAGNPEPSGPVVQAGSPSVQSEGSLQNAKAVNLPSQGSGAEAAVSKLLNADSGNKEEGFSFSSQQQNEMKAAETQNIAKETETVQKEFRAQTLDQIVQKAALHLKNGQNEVQINLKPDFLGQIRMQIITDSQQVTVRILTEFPMVKELIESNAHQLRSELQNYGLDIDELEVSVSQNSDQHVADQNKAGGSKGGKSSENNPGGEAGALATALTASSQSAGEDDGASSRIDFFA